MNAPKYLTAFVLVWISLSALAAPTSNPPEFSPFSIPFTINPTLSGDDRFVVVVNNHSMRDEGYALYVSIDPRQDSGWTFVTFDHDHSLEQALSSWSPISSAGDQIVSPQLVYDHSRKSKLDLLTELPRKQLSLLPSILSRDALQVRSVSVRSADLSTTEFIIVSATTDGSSQNENAYFSLRIRIGPNGAKEDGRSNFSVYDVERGELTLSEYRGYYNYKCRQLLNSPATHDGEPTVQVFRWNGRSWIKVKSSL